MGEAAQVIALEGPVVRRGHYDQELVERIGEPLLLFRGGRGADGVEEEDVGRRDIGGVVEVDEG